MRVPAASSSVGGVLASELVQCHGSGQGLSAVVRVQALESLEDVGQQPGLVESDRRDVEAFCSVSVTHSGVGRRRYAHWLVSDRLWFVREGDDGTAELRVTEGDSPFEQRRRLVDTGPYDVLRRRIDGPLLVDVPA